VSYTEYQDARRAAMCAGLRELNRKNVQEHARIPAGRRTLLLEAADVMQGWANDLRREAVAEEEP
jgi:hypothetical protein